MTSNPQKIDTGDLTVLESPVSIDYRSPRECLHDVLAASVRVTLKHKPLGCKSPQPGPSQPNRATYQHAFGFFTACFALTAEYEVGPCH